MSTGGGAITLSKRDKNASKCFGYPDTRLPADRPFYPRFQPRHGVETRVSDEHLALDEGIRASRTDRAAMPVVRVAVIYSSLVLERSAEGVEPHLRFASKRRAANAPG